MNKPIQSFLGVLSVPAEPNREISVEQYHEMIRFGILTEDDPVELLDGWVIVKAAKTPGHSTSTLLVRQALSHALPAGWHLNSQDPVTLARSEPEPDVMVVRGALRDYLDRHPGPQEVGLVVEVADASLHRDRTTKRLLYAEAAIPVYWIVNLIDRRLEVYTDPSGPGPQPTYRQQQVLSPGDEVPFVLDGRTVAHLRVGDLLP